MVDDPRPVRFRDEHHVEIVRQRHPMSVRPMVEVVVGVVAQIDVRNDAVVAPHHERPAGAVAENVV